MFEPTALETAMLPSPFLATMIEARASGTEVPTARMMRPTMSSGMWAMQAARVAKSTIRNEKSPMCTIDIVNVSGYHFSHFSSRQSGMVACSNSLRGRLTAAPMRDAAPPSSPSPPSPPSAPSSAPDADPPPLLRPTP